MDTTELNGLQIHATNVLGELADENPKEYKAAAFIRDTKAIIGHFVEELMERIAEYEKEEK